MSVNLVDLVLKQVGGNVPGILGSLLGESADRTQGAIAGAVPAILGGLMGAASKGGGVADLIASAVGEQDDGILDDLAGAFGGGSHQSMADQGGNLLSSLLGDGVIGTLVGAIGKFSGLGGGSTKSLLGMLAPIVMSVLSRQQKSEGLDTGGMMNLLMSQKDNIQGAMPAGLSSALGGANFLDDLMGGAQSAASSVADAAGQAASAVGDAAESVGDAARDAASSAGAAVGQGAEAASRAAQNVASTASDAASSASAAATGAAQSGGSWLRWLLPLIILLALLWFAFKFLGGSETVENAGDAASSAVEATTEAASDAAEAAGDAVDAAADAAGDAADAASDAASSAAEAVTAMVGDVDVGGELTSAFDGLTETLSGITDTASAEAAIPALEEVSNGLDNLTGLAEQLPEGAVSMVSELVSGGLESLDGLVANLESIPGVGDLIKPVIDQIKEKLAAFTTA
ncbi:MAG: DUF937 domain-containing protein [Pseudomonadota bacterium]